MVCYIYIHELANLFCVCARLPFSSSFITLLLILQEINRVWSFGEHKPRERRGSFSYKEHW